MISKAAIEHREKKAYDLCQFKMNDNWPDAVVYKVGLLMFDEGYSFARSETEKLVFSLVQQIKHLECTTLPIEIVQRDWQPKEEKTYSGEGSAE